MAACTIFFRGSSNSAERLAYCVEQWIEEQMALEDPRSEEPAPFSEEQVAWLEGLVKRTQADKKGDDSGMFASSSYSSVCVRCGNQSVTIWQIGCMAAIAFQGF